MAIIVEDGSGVTDANSYNSVADAEAFFTARGITTPTEGYDVVLLLAMDVLENLVYAGAKYSDANELAFPRSGVLDVANIAYPSTIVPRAMQRGQLWLAHYIATGSNPITAPAPVVKRKKVDVLETEFATLAYETTRAVTVQELPNVYSAIRHLLRNESGTATGRVIRG